jgi:peptide deformylase
MFLNRKNLVFDDNPELREVCKEVSLPLSNEVIELAQAMREYVINSVIEEKALELDLAPAVGIAAPQVGYNIRLCAINFQDDEGDVDLVMINPVIMKKSKDKVYLESGEACLSVADKKEGFVPRYATIKVKYIDIKGRIKTRVAHDFEAIVIQHELDHLDGVLFYDHINKEDPFKIPTNSFAL